MQMRHEVTLVLRPAVAAETPQLLQTPRYGMLTELSFVPTTRFPLDLVQRILQFMYHHKRHHLYPDQYQLQPLLRIPGVRILIKDGVVCRLKKLVHLLVARDGNHQ
jgi:hypothetical protein